MTEVQGKKDRILIIDDDKRLLASLYRTLYRYDYDVVTSECARRGLDLAKEYRPDLIILDMNMPGLPGLGALKYLKGDPDVSDIPVVIMSGENHKSLKVEASKRGAVDWLSKPVPRHELLSKIANQLKAVAPYKEKVKKQEEEIRRKTDILTGLEGDIRAPMERIMNIFASLCSCDDLSELAEVRERGITETKRAFQFIELLIAAAGMESGEMGVTCERGSIQDLVRERLKQHRDHAERKGVRLGMKLQGDDFEVILDIKRFEQILSNLIDNAIKYSNEEGTVAVVVREFNDNFHLVVQDQGIGIKKEEVPFVFDQYVELTNQPTGGEATTGLGLPMVKRLVDLFGGKVDIKSVENKGTQVTVSLPKVWIEVDEEELA